METKNVYKIKKRIAPPSSTFELGNVRRCHAKKNRLSISGEAVLFHFTKGMGEMFTFKQRGVCLYVIYFTIKRYHGITNKSIFHNLFHNIVIKKAFPVKTAHLHLDLILF